jgi:multidrug efflux system outer membrane protein
MLLLGSAVFFTACSLAPDYEQPAMPVADNYQTAATTAEGAEQSSDQTYQSIAWQDFISDPQLSQLISEALSNNRDLRVAALRVEQAQAIYRIEKSQQYPSVGITGSGTHQKSPLLYNNDEAIHQYQANIGVAAYELDFFARIRNLSEAALQDYLATESAHLSAQVSLISEVAGRYVDYQRVATELELMQQDVESSEQLYSLVEKRVNSGVDNQSALAQANALRQTAKMGLLRNQRELILLQNSLNLLVGKSVAINAVELDSEFVLQEIPAGLPADLLVHRPDILQAESRLRAANANIGVARANFFPRITLTANAGVASDNLSNLFDSSSDAWLFKPDIYLPIFQGGANKARLNAAKAEQAIAIAEYEKSIQQAFKEVANALQTHELLQQQDEASKEQFESIRYIFRLTEERFNQGIESHLSLLYAYREVLAARQQVLSTRQQWLLNRIELYRALGGGWQQTAAVAATEDSVPNTNSSEIISSEANRIEANNVGS